MDNLAGDRARVLLLAGPSGSGKSTLARHSNMPMLELDHFYRDGDEPGMPRSEEIGLIDWDDPASWRADLALAALIELCRTGTANVPVYSISADRRSGTRSFDLGPTTRFVAEGVFAPHLVEPAKRAGILADAIVVERAAWKNHARRLRRDVTEGRKPPLTVLSRSRMLMRRERAVVDQARTLGCRPLDASATARVLRRAFTHGRGEYERLRVARGWPAAS